jgi:hypothetical protein
MTDPFRLRVQKTLADVLRTITPDDGYAYDLSQSVFRGRLYFGDGDPIPMISILEPPVPFDAQPAPPNATTSQTDWNLLVQGFADDDRENPTDPAHLLMAEVKRRLAVEQKRQLALPRRGANPFGLNDPDKRNRVESFKIGGGVVRPPEQQVSNKAYFWLTLTLKITEDNADPFG